VSPPGGFQSASTVLDDNEDQEKRPWSEEAIERLIAEVQDSIERVAALRETVAQVKEDHEWRPTRPPRAKPDQ